MLQVDLLAQLTLPHFVHCQSSAENKPFDFSAAEAPISIPCFLVFSSFFSRPHLLQLDLRAKLTLPHPASEQVQSPSDGLKSPPGILYFIFYQITTLWFSSPATLIIFGHNYAHSAVDYVPSVKK